MSGIQQGNLQTQNRRCTHTYTILANLFHRCSYLILCFVQPAYKSINSALHRIYSGLTRVVYICRIRPYIWKTLYNFTVNVSYTYGSGQPCILCTPFHANAVSETRTECSSHLLFMSACRTCCMLVCEGERDQLTILNTMPLREGCFLQRLVCRNLNKRLYWHRVSDTPGWFQTIWPNVNATKTQVRLMHYICVLLLFPVWYFVISCAILLYPA